MLLGQKKVQGEDQNWCVILNPIPSALDKKRIAERISHVFSLSAEEAADLVANTPIIILDNLNRGIAAKLKDFFRAAGAETVLTNDTFQKRKCYRTVWPQTPNLSFLQSWNPLVDKTQDHSEELGPDEALDEIRTQNPVKPEKEEKKSSMPSITATAFGRQEKEPSAQETERWRKECMKLREESQELRKQVEKLEKDKMPAQARNDKNWIDEKEKEMKQAQILLEHANEKYEVLRQEYANARHLYEEKIGALLQDTERAKRKITELTEGLGTAQREKKGIETHEAESRKKYAVSEERLNVLTQAFEQSKRTIADLTDNLQKSLEEKQSQENNHSQKNKEYQTTIEDLRRAKTSLEEKLTSTTQILEQFKRQAAEYAESLRATQSQKQTLEVAVTQNRQELQKLTEEGMKSKNNYDEKLAAASRELDQLKRQVSELTTSLHLSQQERQSLTQKLEEEVKEIRLLRDEAQKNRLAYEQKILKNSDDVARLELNLKNTTEKMNLLQKSKEQLELTVNTQSEQIAYWHEQHNRLVPQFEEASKKLQAETAMRERLEARGRESDKAQAALTQELQQKNLTLQDQQQKYAGLEERFQQLQESYQEIEKMLENQMKILETRDRELDAARRQIRDVNAQLEQREIIQKKNQLVQTLTEKEAQLKRIVADQHKIENEIKERETIIRSILNQQEAIEKEIVEAKQAQRHMAELAKRDQNKGRSMKPGSHSELPAELKEEAGD